MHALLRGHETQDGEDHKASKEAGPAVDERKDDGVPGDREDGGGRLGRLFAARGCAEKGGAGVLTCSSCC